MVPEIRGYLGEVRTRLHLDPLTERQVMREIYSYFEERIGELREAGLSEREAAKVAVQSFGRAKAMARQMQEAHGRGSWGRGFLAAIPHFLMAVLFALHFWDQAWTALILVLIAGVTLWGWWQGKPDWLFPWVGYSLLPLLIGGYVAFRTVLQIVFSFLAGIFSLADIGVLLAVAIYLSLACWVVVSTSVKVVRRDWILASLMLLPLPVMGAWLLTRDRAMVLWGATGESLHASDLRLAGALLALGLTAAIFIRLRQRPLKLGALVGTALMALTIVLHAMEIGLGTPWLLLAALLLTLFFLSPALVEGRVRPREEWPGEEAWLHHPTRS